VRHDEPDAGSFAQVSAAAVSHLFSVGRLEIFSFILSIVFCISFFRGKWLSAEFSRESLFEKLIRNIFFRAERCKKFDKKFLFHSFSLLCSDLVAS
jgi:hypothetical protein